MKRFYLTRQSSRPPVREGWPSGSQIRLSDDETLTFEFQDQNGNEIGVKLDGETGELQLGGWNSDGDWVELIAMHPCSTPGCNYPDNHASPFRLDQRSP